MSEIDLEIMIGRDKALDKTGTEMIIEGMDLSKTLVETMAEIDVREVFNRSYSSDRSRSRERSLSPRRYNNNRQFGNSRLRSRSRSRSKPKITMNRDRIKCYKCREYDHFMNECSNIGTIDSDGHESE